MISLDLPPGWFLETLRDLRKPIIFVGDTPPIAGVKATVDTTFQFSPSTDFTHITR